MNTISALEAGEGLDALIDQVVASHEPVLITGMERNAVLISEEVWRGIQDTLDLVSIPGCVSQSLMAWAPRCSS